MTVEHFRFDAYTSEFEAQVLSTDGDWVIMDGTMFYPGGGGQVCDTGAIGKYSVTEVKYTKNGDIAHLVPGHDFSEGDKVWCSVDWDRRLDLMMGHTGEHLLFCSLKRQVPDVNIVKIFISPESKYVIIDRDISWDDIAAAVEFANGAIDDNLPVRKSVMDRNDPEIEKIRVKLDRIEEDEITVVEIGDIDIAACSGIHVLETGELGSLFVDRKVSAGKDGFAVHFKVGKQAADAAYELASTCIQIIDELGSKPEAVLKTVRNMKHELESLRSQTKAFASLALSELQPSVIKGNEVYSGVFQCSDRNVLIEASEKHRASGAASVLIGIGDTVSVIVSSGIPGIDCKKILGDVLPRFNGRGGGKSNFAQGGVPDSGDADSVKGALLEAIASQLP